jgi:hypothetical protein
VLTVKGMTFVSGSSNLFSIPSLPALPATLKHDERLTVDVEFRSESPGTFNGILSVETDDPNNPFAEVPLTATGGTCEASCPIANGTPSCSTGVCAVASCNSNFYDTDHNAANGCECAEAGGDPSAFCTGAADLGWFKDSDEVGSTFSGNLPVTSDVDLIRFFAEDANQFFSDEFIVKIRLSTSDPGIRMCVYEHRGNHDADCYWTAENCPSNNYFEHDGSSGTDDNADYLIKIYRDPSSPPTCAGYSVFVSNGQ